LVVGRGIGEAWGEVLETVKELGEELAANVLEEMGLSE
jgi:hypothetical protein